MNPDEERAVKCYEVFRAQIQHEDGLFCQRIVWLVALQAILFVPYFYLGGHRSSPALTSVLLMATRWGLALVGILCCGLVSLSCYAAHTQINRLTEKYRHILTANQVFQLEWLPDLRSDKSIRVMGIVAPFGAIGIFCTIWCVFLCMHFWPHGIAPSVPGLLVALFCLYVMLSVMLERVPTTQESERQANVVALTICLALCLSVAVPVLLLALGITWISVVAVFALAVGLVVITWLGLRRLRC